MLLNYAILNHNERSHLDRTQSNHLPPARLSAALPDSDVLRTVQVGFARPGDCRFFRRHRRPDRAKIQSALFAWRLSRSHRRQASALFLILVVAAVIILASGYRPLPPSIYGKFTTFFQIVLVFMVVLAAAYPQLQLALLNRVLIYIVSALCVFSGLHYSFTIARRLNVHPPAA